MKIWLLAENYPPRRGGIENYLAHIVEQFREMGHEVVIITPDRYRFFWPVLRPAWLPLFVSLWRRAQRERPDILLCGKGLFEGLVGYYFKKHLGIPYVVFTYAMEIAAWTQVGRTRRKLQRVLRNARWVVYINEGTAQVLRKMGARSEQLLKILPGVDQRFLKTVSPLLVESTLSHVGVRQPYIISVGRLVERKGFDTLIEAFSHLDQTRFATVKLVIVGSGPDQVRLAQLVADNYMQTSVEFLTNVPDTHMPALYAGAEFFALTPRNIHGDTEGFGIVYLEAAATGKAAVATRSGGVPEAVVHELTGLLTEAEDSEALTEAFERLLSDTVLRDRLGAQAQGRVQKEFLWSQRRDTLNRLLEPS